MTTLTDLRTRLAASLADDTSLVFTETITTEAIRQALEQIGNIYGTELTIEGLDEADETTLDDKDIPCLLTGAAGHAINAIVASHFTIFTPNIQNEVNLMLRGDKLMVEFRYMLDDLRVEGMQTAPDPPNSPIEWDESYFHDPEVEY
jgi:hypothetical protein